MSALALKAYVMLVRFEVYLIREDFPGLCDKVRRYPVREKSAGNNAIEQVCTATDLACIWYWKEVLCLQRSAATACILKERGIPSKMVIGAQQIPFKAHAWVEVEGRVVSDKPHMRETYAVLDVC